jgi:hypothetical protein
MLGLIGGVVLSPASIVNETADRVTDPALGTEQERVRSLEAVGGGDAWWRD